MKLLESAPIAEAMTQELRQQSAELIDAGINPHLAVVLVGNDPDSLGYIDIKTKKSKSLGVIVSVYHLEEQEPRERIEETLDFLSKDQEVHGIIVQLPLPGNWSREEMATLFAHIAPEKDVDGLRGDWEQQEYANTSLAEIMKPRPHALPPMVASICSLLDYYQIPLANQRVVIVGYGVLVGQPYSAMLAKTNQNYQVVDEDTDNILAITKEADIIVAATGVPNLITYQWVKEGAVVLDCSRDVHRDSVDQVAGAVAPAQGGLGPLTVMWLIRNTIQAAKRQTGRSS